MTTVAATLAVAALFTAASGHWLYAASFAVIAVVWMAAAVAVAMRGGVR